MWESALTWCLELTVECGSSLDASGSSDGLHLTFGDPDETPSYRTSYFPRTDCSPF